jgi:D-3-phosphoglycerate dehydrogenase
MEALPFARVEGAFCEALLCFSDKSLFAVSGRRARPGLTLFPHRPPLSVLYHPPHAFPQVVCTPHLGASTEEAQKKVAREIAQQMSDAFAHRGFVGVSNAPHLSIAHKPAMEPFVRLSEALGRCVGSAWPEGGLSMGRGPLFQ